MTQGRILAGLCVAAIAWPALAAAPDADSALRGCRAERDDVRRLACYDREADRLAPQPPAAAAAAAPAVPAEPALTPEERFGRRGEMVREEQERKAIEARELGELQAVAVEIWTRADGLMMIMLDNGQVWRQNAPDPFFRLKTGDTVRIQPGALGSYLLSGPAKRSTRVTRVK